MKFNKIKNFFKNKRGGNMKTNKNKTNGKQVNNKIINTTKIKNFRGSNKFEQIKNKIYGVNKVLAIVGFLVIAGALLVIGGNVVVKDGQLNVTSNLFVDTNTLYVDSSNNRVGIGTTGPARPLDILGTGNYAQLRLTDDSGATNEKDLLITGVPRTSSQIDVALIYLRTGASANTISIGGQDIHAAGSLNGAGVQGATGIKFYTASAVNTEITSATAPRMVIDSSGNVGIGNSNPGNKLDVTGTINATTVTAGTCCASSIAEMVKIEGNVENGDAICMFEDGKNRVCNKEKSKRVMGIATNRVEILMKASCDDNSVVANGVGTLDIEEWRKKYTNCVGWYPVAIGGNQEGAKVICKKDDGTLLEYGDRLVSSELSGYLKPITDEEDGGDAVFGKAASTCKPGKETDIIEVWVN